MKPATHTTSRSAAATLAVFAIAALAVGLPSLRADVSVVFSNTDPAFTPPPVPPAGGALGTLTLNFSVDGTGNVTLDAESTSADTSITAAVDSWDDSSSVGTISNPAAFNSSFALTLAAVGGSGVRLTSINGGSLGVGGLNAWRIDNNGAESLKVTAADLPSGWLVMKTLSWHNQQGLPTMTASWGDTNTTNVLTSNTGNTEVWDLGSKGILLGQGDDVSFGTGISGDNGLGYSIAALSFDFVETAALVDDDGSSTTGWLSSVGAGVLNTTTESGFLTFATTTTANSNQHFLKYFDATTLQVGEAIGVTARFKFTGLAAAANTNNHRFRFGLFDSTAVTKQTANGHANTIGTGINGYMGSYSRLAGSPTHLYQSDPGNNSFMVQAVGNFEGLNTSEGDGGALADDTLYTLRFSVQRTPSGNFMTWTMDNKVINVSWSDTGGSVAPAYTFDTVGFAVLDSPDAIVDLRFDSILVDTTVTPGTGPGPDPEIKSITVSGGTATIVMTGKPSTTYLCKSSDDLVTAFGAIATTPATVTTDGSGNATFDVDASVAKRFYLVEEE